MQKNVYLCNQGKQTPRKAEKSYTKIQLFSGYAQNKPLNAPKSNEESPLIVSLACLRFVRNTEKCKKSIALIVFAVGDGLQSFAGYR